MASAMETNDSDIPSESESDDSTGSEVQDDEFSTANYSDAENHKNVLKTIYKYSKRGKYCDVTLVAGKDAKRYVVRTARFIFLVGFRLISTIPQHTHTQFSFNSQNCSPSCISIGEYPLFRWFAR